ncbi:MAG: cyclic-di-AMP receptor [Sedimentibacter sp.]|uniref:cyclic-di-AMP receptor n=1 Tax=Sedimentibacter sp. TaxID=1960295 RepID=UPI002980CA09|nr:cyclic-di-AMP receptor [Sedimentibacter sp.]MDW5300590.1 cyclic-di-AMP receptor [Sedimentibacter sp.]
MKLITAIVQNDDAKKLISSLRENGYSSTKMSSTGGFLSSGNTTIISVVEDDDVDQEIEIIRKICKVKKKITAAIPPSSYSTVGGYLPQTIEVTVGGAVVFVTPIERFEKI